MFAQSGGTRMCSNNERGPGDGAGATAVPGGYAMGRHNLSTTLVDKGELESARRSSACFASSRDACIYAYDVSFDKGSLVY